MVDQFRTSERPPERPVERHQTAVRKKGPNPTLIALIGLLAVAAILVAISMFRGRDNQDRLSDSQTNGSSAQDPEERCASKATYDLVKRDLFRRAAQVRGSDQASFDRLAAYSTLRGESPILTGRNRDVGSVSCSAAISLDLPPGVAVVGGRRTLTADIDYQLQGAADGTGDVITIANADAIVTPLATLTRTGAAPASAANQPADEPTIEPDSAPVGVDQPTVRPAAPAPPAPSPPREPEPAATSARPSFNCVNARTRGEIAVCNSSELAALDRQMASQFGSALSGADGGQRALLTRTRTRFLRFRDSCRTNSCIADAYRGRMREISDIRAGRWQP
ncbi:MAG: hypothetical protein M3Q52_00745 [Pseudomonadota bacterium]|nr:hypothetical protein [Pseudomonadota bacterium]